MLDLTCGRESLPYRRLHQVLATGRGYDGQAGWQACMKKWRLRWRAGWGTWRTDRGSCALTASGKPDELRSLAGATEWLAA